MSGEYVTRADLEDRMVTTSVKPSGTRNRSTSDQMEGERVEVHNTVPTKGNQTSTWVLPQAEEGARAIQQEQCAQDRDFSPECVACLVRY
jgi:hypothetical protein